MVIDCIGACLALLPGRPHNRAPSRARMRNAMDRYAVVGQPVAHSLSPQIHAAFAEQVGAELSYEAIEAPLEGFAATITDLFDRGYRGVNVTVPFKGEACTFAHEVDPAAARAEAANTLRVEADGRTTAFTTDGVGLVRDLLDHQGVDPHEAVTVLLGAGGAAAGVIEPLLAAGVAELVVANRTQARADALVARFADLGPVRAVGLDALPRADLVINATAASLDGQAIPVSAGAVHGGTFVYDMMYGPKARPFLAHCSGLGIRGTADGLGMLVEQAASAFELWRGVRPRTAPVLASLRASMND